MRPAAAFAALVLLVVAGVGGLIAWRSRAKGDAAAPANAAAARAAVAKNPGKNSSVSPGSVSNDTLTGPAENSSEGAALSDPASFRTGVSSPADATAEPAAGADPASSSAVIAPPTATAAIGEILVRVTDDATGAPVAGAKIAHSVRGQRGDHRTTTAADGLARVPFVAAGEHWFEVTHVDYTGVAVEGKPGAIAKRSIVRLEEGGAREVTIRLRVGATLRGTVRDASGNLLARASVHVGKQVARTDDAGAFVVRGLEGGVTHLVVYHDNHPGEASADVTIPARGDPPVVELRMPPSVTLAGTVVDPDGRGVADASIAVRGGRVRKQVTSRAEGRFRIEGLPPGDYRVQIDRKGFAPLVIEKVTVPATGIEDVLLRIEPATEKSP